MSTTTPSTAHADSSALRSGDVIDRYVVDGLLGSGGTATVYRVRHKTLGTTYALKVLGLVSASIRRRTLQEGRLQAALDHPNVVGVYDILDVGGAPGLLMEFVEGPTLEAALTRHRFSTAHIDTIFQGVVEGVAAAHARGFVHRDLKPGNVLLAQTADGLLPKVTDFGIAKALDEQLDGGAHTRVGIAMGTPQYMAPEQIRDASGVDLRADLFSLGAVLYELCTGHRAFDHDDVLKVYNAVCNGTFHPPRHWVPDLHERFVEAIDGCLLVDRERRIPDCDTLLAVVRGRRNWLSDEPTEAGGVEGFGPEAASAPEAEPHETTTRLLPAALLAELIDRPDDLSAAELIPETASLPLPVTRSDGAGRVAPDATVGVDERGHVLPRGTSVRAVGPDTLLGGEATPEVAPRRWPLLAAAAALAALLAGWAYGLQGLQEPAPAAAPREPSPGAGSASATDEGAEGSGEGVGLAAQGTPAAATDRSATDRSNEGEARVTPPRARNTPAAPAAAPSAASKPTTPGPAPRASTPSAATGPSDAAAGVAPKVGSEASPGGTAAAGATAALPVVKLLSAPPTATLVIDGRPAGRTPHKLSLPAGRHQVQVQSGDATASFAIDVRADAENKWCFVFAQQRAVRGSCPP